MDGFKYTVMLQALGVDPLQIQLDTFEDALPTLSKEDLDELFTILNQHVTQTHPLEEGIHLANMLQALWHYR